MQTENATAPALSRPPMSGRAPVLGMRGINVPKLGMGTWQIEGDLCQRQVEAALAMGYRHLDTAQMYENEGAVGSAIRQSGVMREELFVTTKVGIDHVSADDVRRSVHDSLRRLGLDHVDLLLQHWPVEEDRLDETLGAINALMEEGATRAIGVSNFPPRLLDRALRIAPIVANQVEYHPFLGQPRLLGMAREHQLVLTAYSPLAQGEVVKSQELRAIGERYGKSPAQVALRWLVQQPHVVAIPKASSRDHLRENLAIFDFALTPDEMKAIHDLDRGERIIDPSFAPEWGER